MIYNRPSRVIVGDFSSSIGKNTPCGAPFLHILHFNVPLLFIFIRLTDLCAFHFCFAMSESGLTPLSTYISSICLYSLNMTDNALSPNILHPLSNDIYSCAPRASGADTVCNTCVKMAFTAIMFRLLVVVILFTISTLSSWDPHHLP